MTFEALPDDLPGIPLLLRAARGSFAAAIRSSIAAAGMPALPTNGPFVLGGLHADPDSFAQIVRHRGGSMEKYHTVDRLFEAGYLIGSVDEPVLSELGHHAAHVSYEAIDALTSSLNDCLGDDGMKSFVRGLLFLISDKESREDD